MAETRRTRRAADWPPLPPEAGPFGPGTTQREQLAKQRGGLGGTLRLRLRGGTRRTGANAKLDMPFEGFEWPRVQNRSRAPSETVFWPKDAVDMVVVAWRLKVWSGILPPPR